MYDVETKILVQAVKRNITWFPDDFMFQLDVNEFAILRSQSVTSSVERPAQRENLKSQSTTASSWAGRRTPPYAFTEQGAAMLSSVLRSERAVAVNIAIMRAFVQMRVLLDSHTELARNVEELERRMTETYWLRCSRRPRLVARSARQSTPLQTSGRADRSRPARAGVAQLRKPPHGR